jgi:spore coat protein U-like protein
MRKSVYAAIAAGISLALAGAANAASPATTSFPVTASVAHNCFVTATDLDFEGYDAGADKTASSSVKVRCTNGTSYTVKLSAGSGSYAQREMLSGANKLQYNLYTDAGYTDVWGDSTDSTDVVVDEGAGLAEVKEKTHTVYGKIPDSEANQNAPAGDYADSITVTVEY